MPILLKNDIKIIEDRLKLIKAPYTPVRLMQKIDHYIF